MLTHPAKVRHPLNFIKKNLHVRPAFAAAAATLVMLTVAVLAPANASALQSTRDQSQLITRYTGPQSEWAKVFIDGHIQGASVGDTVVDVAPQYLKRSDATNDTQRQGYFFATYLMVSQGTVIQGENFWQASGSSYLPGGRIDWQGLVKVRARPGLSEKGRTYTYSIVGGTKKYSSARGTLKLTKLGEGLGANFRMRYEVTF
jgi:hypothetical protein